MVLVNFFNLLIKDLFDILVIVWYNIVKEKEREVKIMVVYVLMYKYKSGSFGLLDVFYNREDAEKYRDICIKINKKNRAKDDYEYRIESTDIKTSL